MKLTSLLIAGLIFASPAFAEKLIFAEGVAADVDAATDAAIGTLKGLCTAHSKNLESYDFIFESCAAGSCKVLVSGTCDAPEALVYGRFGGDISGDYGRAVSTAKRSAMRNALAQCEGPIVGATEVITSYTCEGLPDASGYTCRAFTVVRCH